MFTTKLRPNESLDRYKALLVAKGYTQTYKILLNGELEEVYMDPLLDFERKFELKYVSLRNLCMV